MGLVSLRVRFTVVKMIKLNTSTITNHKTAITVTYGNIRTDLFVFTIYTIRDGYRRYLLLFYDTEVGNEKRAAVGNV